jgi:hypothetical protein
MYITHMKKKKYLVRVYWEMCAEHTVYADGPNKAARMAKDAPLPKDSANWQFVPDSENVDLELDVQLIK